MTLSVTKSIMIRGLNDFDYVVTSEGGNYLSVFLNDSSQEFDKDNPVLYLTKEEANALSRALSELANGY